MNNLEKLVSSGLTRNEITVKYLEVRQDYREDGETPMTLGKFLEMWVELGEELGWISAE